MADELPEWSNHIQTSRLSHLENISKLRTQPHNLVGPPVSQQVLSPVATNASQQQQIEMQPNTNNHSSNISSPVLSHISVQQQKETQSDTCTNNHSSNVPPLVLSGKSPSHTNTSQQPQMEIQPDTRTNNHVINNPPPGLSDIHVESSDGSNIEVPGVDSQRCVGKKTVQGVPGLVESGVLSMCLKSSKCLQIKQQ